MNGLASLQTLKIANTMSRSATPLRVTTGLGMIRGMVLWERNGGGALDYAPPDHCTLSIYQAGGFGVRSKETGRTGFSDAICVLPEDYETHWLNAGYVSNLHIYFRKDELEALNWQKSSRLEPMIFGIDPVLKSLSHILLAQLDWTAANDRLTMEQVLVTMLSRLGAPDTRHDSGVDPHRRIFALIEERLADLESGPPSLIELAREANMSPRHLSRVFKKVTGQTLSERHRERQMQRAAVLIRTDRPLAEIALECGFSAQSHFTTAYRRYFGRTPHQSRRNKPA